MKNSLIIFFAITCATALFTACCKDAKTIDPAEPVTSTQEFPEDTLSLQPLLYSLASASADIKSLDSLVCEMKKKNITVATPKAYTIHNCDLLRAMGMSCEGATDMHVRVYLGYHAGEGFKLFVVPAKDVAKAISDSITSAGVDHFINSTGAIVKFNSNMPSATFNVLDLNAPCPNTCDKSSPLYKVNYTCK